MNRGGSVSRWCLALLLAVVTVVLPGPTPPAGAAAAAGAGPPMQPPLSPLTVLTPFSAPATRYGPGHRGVDLAATAGGGVRAPAPGIVVFAGRLVDRGVVSLQHDDGLRTSLEPVTASVTIGQRVLAGAVVGTVEVGHPQCAPAVCLHWGVRLDGAYLDPMALQRPVRVRLLPWDG
ncbi:MAG: M23 family metallopeptidase [Nakamurella sp.]